MDSLKEKSYININTNKMRTIEAIEGIENSPQNIIVYTLDDKTRWCADLFHEHHKEKEQSP